MHRRLGPTAPHLFPLRQSTADRGIMLMQVTNRAFELLRRENMLVNKILTQTLLLRVLVIQKRFHLKERKQAESNGSVTEAPPETDRTEYAVDRRGIQPPPPTSNVAYHGPLPSLPDQPGNQLLVGYYPPVIEVMAEFKTAKRQWSAGKGAGTTRFFPTTAGFFRMMVSMAADVRVELL